MPGRPSWKPLRKLLMLGIWVFMATKKAPYKGAFDVL
jgi:hypothetical protein